MDAADDVQNDGIQETNFNQCTIEQMVVNTTAVSINCAPQPTLQVDTATPPPTKKAKAGPSSRRVELKEILNRSIIKENVNIFRFRGDLTTPSEERFPELREWKMYDSQNRVRRPANSAQDDSSGLGIKMNQLFANGIRFVVITGGPGSGKSTFVRRYGIKVLNKEVEGMEEICIVYFVDARKLSKETEEKIQFSEFFFSKLVHGFDIIGEDALEWLQSVENQRQILIIIDGLNELQHLSMDKPYEAVRYGEAASPAVLLYNLLQGRLLPEAKILAASRSYGIQDYDTTIRPQKIIKLVGFTEENAEYLFREMVGPVIGEKWEKIFSDVLKSLCSIPLYLVYVAFMQKSHADLEMDDVSSILMRLIQNFWNRNGWDKDPEPFRALKKFCLKMLKRGQVDFTTSDLAKNGLREEHILSICITEPATYPGVLENSVGRRSIYFNHMLIQESLACLGFLDLPLSAYTDVVRKYLDKFPFRAVKNLACGILFNRRPQFNELIDVSSMEEKKGILLKKLHQSLSAGLSPNQMLHHLACLHEIGRPIEEFNILPNAVDLSMQIPTTCSTHMIAPAIAICKYLSELVLYHCVLDDDKVKILWRSLRDSDIKINALNLGFNPNIGPDGLKTVAKTSCHCRVRHLDLHACGLTPDHMTKFLNEFRRKGSKKIKLESLHLRSNPELGEEGLEAVAVLVEVGKLKKLDVSCCDVSASKIEKMNRYNLRSLQVLVLTKNTKQSPSQKKDPRMSAVGKCIKQNEIEELHVNSCALDLHDLESLEESLRGIPNQLKTLNVSNNKISSNECHEVLCKIARNCGTEMMDIHSCGFSENQKRRLKKYVKELTYPSIELNSDEFREILERNRGKFLEVSLNGTQGKLEELLQQVERYGTRFRKLCLLEERTATSRDIKILLEIIPHISEELWLNEWVINLPERQRLQKGVDRRSDYPNFKIYISSDDVLQRPKS